MGDENEQEQLKERLDAARARQRSAEAKRERLQSERATLEEVEAAELEARDEEAIAKAEDENDARRIAVVRSSYGAVILRRPNPVIYKRFRDRGEAKTVDLEKLVRGCLLYPDVAGFDRILDEEPGTLDRCASSVIELAGFRLKEVSGK